MIINNHLARLGPVLLVEDNIAHAELIMAAAAANEPVRSAKESPRA